MKYFLVAFLLSFTSVSFAQFSFAPINVPDAVATEARGTTTMEKLSASTKPSHAPIATLKSRIAPPRDSNT